MDGYLIHLFSNIHNDLSTFKINTRFGPYLFSVYPVYIWLFSQNNDQNRVKIAMQLSRFFLEKYTFSFYFFF